MWSQQPKGVFDEAIMDFDGVIVGTTGECKFSQIEHLDRWNEQSVKFNFGYECRPNLKALAEDLPESTWKPLKQSQRTIQTTERARPVNVMREVIRQRGNIHLELEHQDIAEFEYTPTACHRGYRMIVVRKNISREQGDSVLFDEIRCPINSLLTLGEFARVFCGDFAHQTPNRTVARSMVAFPGMDSSSAAGR